MVGADHPTMTVAMNRQLEELGHGCWGRVWPGPYPAVERAFANFRVVLQDLRNAFLSHAEK